MSRTGSVCCDKFQPVITRGEPARLKLNLKALENGSNRENAWNDFAFVNPAF